MELARCCKTLQLVYFQKALNLEQTSGKRPLMTSKLLLPKTEASFSRKKSGDASFTVHLFPDDMLLCGFQFLIRQWGKKCKCCSFFNQRTSNTMKWLSSSTTKDIYNIYVGRVLWQTCFCNDFGLIGPKILAKEA